MVLLVEGFGELISKFITIAEMLFVHCLEFSIVVKIQIIFTVSRQHLLLDILFKSPQYSFQNWVCLR